MQPSPLPPSQENMMIAGITKTTLYGNIGKYAGLVALIVGAILPTLPTEMHAHIAQTVLALNAIANAFNGQGNIKSVTGTSKD